ncbi:hypothetical protein DE146DRAFT_661383 [Phaeosphaeria sp. MPI-PUGE-AT-0046c]|nr:hypothetical protein DE146DRAFT_661383 [Phaeosphaeria sp. MPI-PUGE-AT-0046c]
MLDLAKRRRICEDTIARSSAVAASTRGGSLAGHFIASQLPALDRTQPAFRDFPHKPVKVYNSDAFALARTLQPTVGKVGVLNLASNYEPGGGWRRTISRTQEEALCYSSTLYSTFNPEWYPWPNMGPGSCAGIISPNVVVFKDTLDNDCAEFEDHQRHVLTVITVAAPCGPRVTEDRQDFAKESDKTELRDRIVLILRMAATNNVTSLVLGAMGCGAYGCPPRAVAREMKAVLESQEFRGWFEDIFFAVYAAGATGRENFEIFSEVFESS